MKALLEGELGMKVILGTWVMLLASSALWATTRQPVTPILPVYLSGSVSNKKLGFAFDLPPGWRAEESPAPGTYWIRSSEPGAPLFTLEAENRYWFHHRLYDPADTLLSFVRQHFGRNCDADGPDGGRRADSLLSIRRLRTPNGVEAVQFTAGVFEEWLGGEVANGTAPDTLEAGSRRFVAGPSFVVDLSRPGRRLLVWVVPDCGDPPAQETIETVRAVVRSLKRL